MEAIDQRLLENLFLSLARRSDKSNVTIDSSVIVNSLKQYSMDGNTVPMGSTKNLTTSISPQLTMYYARYMEMAD